MSKYEATFNGGPYHGEIIPLPKAESTYKVTKVYDGGLTTEPTYKIHKAEDEKLFYDLEQEVFVKYTI